MFYKILKNCYLVVVNIISGLLNNTNNTEITVNQKKDTTTNDIR